MKTYQATIERPLLEIRQDYMPESPREWDNIGYFFTKERNHISPDGTDHELYAIMVDTQDEATDTESHMRLIKKEAKAQGHDILAIYPVYRYEHDNVVYRRGTGKGFDVSNCGFYIITKESAKDEEPADFERIVDGELKNYTSWANGEVYGYTLYDELGEVVDSCSGFYSVDDIKTELPKEWAEEDMQQYFI